MTLLHQLPAQTTNTNFWRTIEMTGALKLKYDSPRPVTISRRKAIVAQPARNFSESLAPR
jgi:hypothetical protein